MRPILSHASRYPPQDWDLISRPVMPSEDPLWRQMTEQYVQRMAARRMASATRADTITEANLRMLDSASTEHLIREASLSRMNFEEEKDISYILLSIEVYKGDRVRVFKDRMETVEEDEEWHAKTQPTNGLDLEVTDKLREFGQLLINDNVLISFRPRLHEIIQQYSQKAARNSTLDSPALSQDLLALREEVEANVRECRLELDWQTVEIPKVGNTPTKPHTRNTINMNFGDISQRLKTFSPCAMSSLLPRPSSSTLPVTSQRNYINPIGAFVSKIPILTRK